MGDVLCLAGMASIHDARSLVKERAPSQDSASRRTAVDSGLRRRLERAANSNQMTACVFGITGGAPEVSLCLRPFGIRSEKHADGGPPAGKHDAGAVGAIAGVLELLDRVRSIFGNGRCPFEARKILMGLSSYPVRDSRPAVSRPSSTRPRPATRTRKVCRARMAGPDRPRTSGLCGETRDTQNPNATAADVSINDAMMQRAHADATQACDRDISFRSDAGGAGL